MRLLEEDIELNRKTKHNIEVIIDKLLLKEDRMRIADALSWPYVKGKRLNRSNASKDKPSEDLLFPNSCLRSLWYLPNYPVHI